jgi:multidrug efflux pump subunit AcrA (membrane-fusion protein)
VPHQGLVWSHAAPLLTRLLLFVGGTLLWAAQVDAAARIAVAGLLVGTLSLASFMLCFALPLWPGEGRRFVAACFGGVSATGRPSRTPGPASPALLQPGAQAGPSKAGRGFYVSGALITLLALAGAMLLTIGAIRAPVLSGTAGVVLGLAFAGAILWLWTARTAVGPIGYARAAPGRPWPQSRAMPGGHEDAGGHAPSLDERLSAGAMAWPSNQHALRLAIALAVIVAVAFLPYPYESGGAFTVLPYDRVTLPARVSGELTEILVREGQWVNEGQIVGTLADWNEMHSLALAQAELEQAKAKLQNLLISPKPEEVEVARRQYELALARLPYSKADYERKFALVKTNDISVQQFQLALSTYQQDLAAVEITRANYDLVRVGPTAAQIAEARAAVQQQTEQVSYWKDQLDRTRIRATAAGQVVTPDPQLMLGKFLQEGTTFLQLEDHRIAHVEVLVPETDIRDVHVGGLLRAKAWGYEQKIWPGKVVMIAPSAQTNQAIAGNVVRVVAEVPNPDGLLRPDMSGYAKIETVHMPLWYSYARAIMRFLLIEVWSWIP